MPPMMPLKILGNAPDLSGTLHVPIADGTRSVPDTMPQYWRSLEQLADTPEFRAGLERQPALGAAEALHGSRRRFLQTMGASLGLAGLSATGCIRLPEEKLAPYAHRPENRTPGTPVSLIDIPRMSCSRSVSEVALANRM